jgi:hypothetical protein
MLTFLTKLIVTTYYIVVISILTSLILVLNKFFSKSTLFLKLNTRFLYYLSKIAFTYQNFHFLFNFIKPIINKISKLGITPFLIFKSMKPVFKGRGHTIHYNCTGATIHEIYFYLFFTLTNQQKFLFIGENIIFITRAQVLS